ncbi:MAG TPA: nucleotidyltransferase family protein [Gemmataceae bacterium]|jgi:bifunctional UDP-N-acetylglucosamine pyrophosphorylase/glucosamine-1-phosphate N-acetyltransferase
MDAILLAAGLGTRLRPHTLQTPKPLLPVQGRPILDWTLAALPKQVERVLVVVHYLGERVEEYLRQQQHFKHWQIVRQENPRGTGDAVLACREHLRSPRFLAINGDDLFAAADLAKLAACSAGILCYPVEEPRRFGIAFRKTDGTLDRLVEKPDLEGRHLANTGAYIFPRAVFDIPLTLSPRGEYEVTQYVHELAKQQTVQVVEASFWLPIGTVEVWEAAQKMDLNPLLG